MLAEAGKVLKALSTAHMTSMKTTGLNDEVGSRVDGESPYGIGRLRGGNNALENEEEGLGGLLDSGASNSLRPAMDGEMEMASRVKVTLAGEDTKVLNQTALGIIIIVPHDKAKESSPSCHLELSSLTWGALRIGQGVPQGSLTLDTGI